jgi:hypothetical protein
MKYTLGMAESGKNEFIGKKSYEIAYALWRIAAHAPEKTFADILHTKAIELVGFAADVNYAGSIATGDALQAIIKFAVDVNCISIPNAAILAREIGNLNAAISEIAAIEPIGGFADIDIVDIFSAENKSKTNLRNPEKIEEVPMEEFFAEEGGDPSFEVPESGKKAEMRQAAILERIRQNGDCRLGDIQAILPGVSERTLRYDIESLVQQNLIERLGTGGRSVYYRARPVVNEA